VVVGKLVFRKREFPRSCLLNKSRDWMNGKYSLSSNLADGK
jgi:hypothetical protein